MCGSMVDIQCAAAEIRRGKKERKIERNYRMKILWSALLHRATIISWGAPNYRTDLSRWWAEVHHIVRTCGGDTAA